MGPSQGQFSFYIIMKDLYVGLHLGPQGWPGEALPSLRLVRRKCPSLGGSGGRRGEGHRSSH